MLLMEHRKYLQYMCILLQQNDCQLGDGAWGYSRSTVSYFPHSLGSENTYRDLCEWKVPV